MIKSFGLILLLVLAFLSSFAQSAHASSYKGVSDLALTPDAVAFYDFVGKDARSGASKPLWHLEETSLSGTKTRLNIGFVVAWDVNHGDPAACFNVGVPLGAAGSLVGDIVNSTSLDIPNVPNYLKDAANFITIGAFGGHEIAGPKWIGGIGGKVQTKYDLSSLANLFK